MILWPANIYPLITFGVKRIGDRCFAHANYFHRLYRRRRTINNSCILRARAQLLFPSTQIPVDSTRSSTERACAMPLDWTQ